MCNVKPYGYIYITTNLINGKRYIGQKAYNYFVDSYKGSGKYLRKAIDKYGWDNFKTDVIEWCRDQEELDNCERYWIALYDAVNSDKFYNLATGGEGIHKGSKLSEEAKRHMSENHAEVLGFLNPFYGKHHTVESRKKMSLSRTGSNNHFYGKHHTEDSKNKLAESHKGKNHNEETRKKISETKRKNPYRFSDAQRLRMSQTRKGENSPLYGKISITDGNSNKFIYLKELDFYESLGYRKGLTRKKGR